MGLPALAILWSFAPTAVAQAAGGSAYQREVVQPLPSPAVAQLNSALHRLAADVHDVSALVDAGAASLKLDDIDAAIGFFSRAAELAPDNPHAKAGLGAAFVRSENPYDALLLFEEAERAGALPATLAGDRGFAHDLVGDNAGAQAFYREALALGPDAEVRRRLALSLAITGQLDEAEETLLPLLKEGDLAAFRMRAFVLAIHGRTKEAMKIVESVMPEQLADEIGPYLRYMPRLTPAQQVAAASFGHFPPAGEIGEDDPRIARYASNKGSRNDIRNVDAALIPAGQALGSAAKTAPSGGRAKIAGSSPPQSTSVPEAVPQAPTQRPPAVETASRPSPVPAGTTAQSPEPSFSIAFPVPEVTSERTSGEPGGNFDLGSFANSRLAQVTDTQQGKAPEGVGTQSPATGPHAGNAKPTTGQVPQTVAEAFSGFVLPPPPVRRPAGAVDITKIEPKREVQPAPEPKPVHPSRLWVQVATGRDIQALAFDWRRFARKAPDAFNGFSPYVTPWGEANRLLAGPFDSAAKAREFMKALKEAGIDTFTFTSPAGQAIDELKAKR